MKITNRRAFHEYHILESLEAGIELLGSEVKAIRSGRIDLGQSYARVLNGQIYLVNANIPRYQNAPIKNYEPTKSRRLLLHRNQITTLIGKTSSGGITLVPVSIYEKNNLIKVQIGVAKSKKEFDKRKVIKERDHQRRVEQELRGKE